jgi:hypothetical protein
MAKKISDADAVQAYMNALEHPFKNVIELLRTIIKGADSKVMERIKWNAPSYYYKEDFVTFNPRDQKRVHLVFHHPAIASIPSDILEGDYIDRRMAYFNSEEDILAKKERLESVINELIKIMDERAAT